MQVKNPENLKQDFLQRPFDPTMREISMDISGEKSSVLILQSSPCAEIDLGPLIGRRIKQLIYYELVFQIQCSVSEKQISAHQCPLLRHHSKGYRNIWTDCALSHSFPRATSLSRGR